MRDDPFVLLLTGFVLTSIVGGALAYVFQQRAWRHQHDEQRADLAREQALRTFEEVSVLLDRRLYRMRRLFWASRRLARDPGRERETTGLDAELTAYRSVVHEWNDNLNRIPALVYTYFGAQLRDRLQDELYDTYSAIGEELDAFVVDVSKPPGPPVRIRAIDRRLADLSDRVYAFNVDLLRPFRDDPQDSATPRRSTIGPPRIGFGSKGEQVRELQAALCREGATGVGVDGHFGRRTEQALIEFQERRGLERVGVVDSDTLLALGLRAGTAGSDGGD